MRTDGDRGCFGDTARGAHTRALAARVPHSTSRRVISAIVAMAAIAVAAPAVAPVPGGGGAAQAAQGPIHEYPVPAGSHPHDVAPAPDGSVWYTAQTAGVLGRLDPATGNIVQIKLGEGAAPHGVIIGPDGAPWITDGGFNAIVTVSPATETIRRFPLPAGRAAADLNTAAFDREGHLWFTGQNGIYGRLTLSTGQVEVWDAPHGRGPYGISVTPQGAIYFASLAGSYVGRIDTRTGAATVLQPPTPNQGARRVWSDARGRIWVSEWNAGKVALYDPGSARWKEWSLPGAHPMPYAVYVDDQGMVWLTDWGSNALVRFDPAKETFEAFPFPSDGATVRQLSGRRGEVWGAESGLNKLFVWRRP